MARITGMPTSVFPVRICDVSRPVGFKWFQYRDDVLWVQHDLNKLVAKGKVPIWRQTKPTHGPWAPQYPSLALLEFDEIFGPKNMQPSWAISEAGSVLADGEVDPVYHQISKLKGDPISAGCLRTYTSLPRFPMVRLRRDDSELAKEVRASLSSPASRGRLTRLF